MSLQLSILKVLSSHPDGRATSVAMQRDLAILAASGPEWSARMNQLAARAPALDIFTEGFVSRDPTGWQLTAVGREFLKTLEAAPNEQAGPIATFMKASAMAKVVNLHDRRNRRRIRRASRSASA